ncbi:MAG: hypothetical protein IK092_03910 [Muribaculaceae bacterium]|nr:hypothetical protein [Muribaculaceae bacterium]
MPQDKSGEIRDRIDIDLLASANGQAGLNSSQVMVLDLVASSIKDGWKRPCYFAYTVDPDLYTAFLPYLRNTGLALQVTPLLSNTESQADILCNTDKMYDIVTKKFIWGGLDRVGDGSIYLDQTVRNMVSTMRRTMLDLATDLISEEKYDKAMNVLTLMETKMPEKVCDYDLRMGGALTIARLYDVIGDKTNNEKAKKRAVEITKKEILRYAKYMRFYKSLYDEYGLDDSGQFAFAGRLSAIDNNVMYYYMPQLLRFYEQINPDDYQKVFDSLNTLDTDNVKGVAGFIQQMKTVYEQGLQARYAPEEQAPDDDNQESNAAQDIAAALMPQNDEQE